ncbi:MAG: nucleoside deaminase [Aureliella sp.]
MVRMNMDEFFFTARTPLSEALLKVLAYLPTASLPKLVAPQFWFQLSDSDFMYIAVELALKSYEEGGCPIGAVIVDHRTRSIVGKGHNTLVQENHPYNHGETSALRDAGSIDFSQTTMFTTLTPCNVCACLLIERGFPRVVIGNSPDDANNEEHLRAHGLEVDLLPDARGIELYERFRREKPELDIIDWKGIAGLKRKS